MKNSLARSFAALLLAGLPAATAGTFSFSPFTGDADSGISNRLTYTSKVDFTGNGLRNVNGVSFNETAPTGTNYVLTGAGNDFPGFANNVTGDAGGLLTDFRFTGDNSGNASLTLSGLTVGQQYVTSWYNAAFGGAGGRLVNISASDTGTAINFDENYTGAGNGNILRYAFTATAPTITYSFDAASDGDSFHHYALTNSVKNTAVLSTPVVTEVSGAGPGYSPFTVRNNDLLQTRVSSVNSGGTFSLEGAGGVAALTNGQFTINGGNPGDNSQLATGENNAFVEYNLDTIFSPRGYDISSIETYGGWNDSGRDRQLFKISYSLVGSPDFVYFAGLDDNPGSPAGLSAVRAIFEASLTGVDAVRFDFFGGQEANYAGYGEIDVVGTATVPEPGALCLALFSGATLLLRRRGHRSRR